MARIFVCPGCKKKLQTPDPLAGKKVRCPNCQAVLSIPPLPASDVAAKVSAANSNPAEKEFAPPSAEKPAPPVRKVQPPPAPKPPGIEALLPPVAGPSMGIVAQRPAAKPSAAPPPKKRDPFFDDDDTEYRLAPELPPANPPPTTPDRSLTVAARDASLPPTIASSVRQTKARPIANLSKRRTPRFLYAAFALAFLPLVFLTRQEEPDIEKRFAHTIAAHPETIERIKSIDAKAEQGKKLDEKSLEDEIFAALPDEKLDDAFLPRHSWWHWGFALLAAGLFLTMVRVLFEPGKSTTAQLLVVGMATATVGVLMLLMFQWLAAASQSFWLRGGNIAVMLFFYFVKFIGWSYHAALDPSTGLLESMVGFTFGVGLCEEIVKAIPILCATRMDRKLDWRGACAWGLASGVGFGVAEGIMYSSSYYNGIEGVDIYFVRFLSCVALHASWTEAVSIMIWENRSVLEQETWYEWLLNLLRLIAVPMALHGLYDTLLKREMKFYAILVAAVSFAWLMIVIERAREGDDEEEEPAVRRFAVPRA
jgi:RsiW-degrading membrane proteinase PrsW (M82 family)